MSASAILVMSVTWSLVIGLTAFCLRRMLKIDFHSLTIAI